MNNPNMNSNSMTNQYHASNNNFNFNHSFNNVGNNKTNNNLNFAKNNNFSTSNFKKAEVIILCFKFLFFIKKEKDSYLNIHILKYLKYI